MKKFKLLMLISILSACNTDVSNTEKVKESNQTKVSVDPNKNYLSALGWQYSEEKDPMTEKVRYFARLESKNLVHLDFPYEGGSSLEIIVRKMNGVNEVILSLSKGQFSSSYDNKVMMKFDDGAVVSYSFLEPADHSSDYIFIEAASGLIKKLKKHDSLKIQPPLFDAGQIVFEFKLDSLVWNH